MELANETVIKKPKRLTSVVWNHFERVRKADICYALCVHCNKKLSGSSNSGTTHLRNHLMRCLKRFNYDVSQLLSAKKKKKDSTLANANTSYDEEQRKEDFIKPTIVKYEPDQRKEEAFNLQSSWFDQERSRLDLARMIILHGYPLAMVEHVGFKVFVKNLQPLFDVALNNTIEVSCMEIYGKERLKVHDMLSKLQGRINLAVEMWSSPENSNHVCMTAHYVGDDWKLQKKILNFVTLDSSHTNDKLSEVIVKCLMDWDIESKFYAVTFDDFSIADDIVLIIKEQISESKSCLSNGQLLDVRSAAHVLDSLVQDAMEALRLVIQKIRLSVRYVKSSQSIQGKFQEISQETGIKCQKSLVLDFPIQWNSTYLMLETAIEYKNAFCQFPDLDHDHTLSVEEWEWASSITGYLKLFIEIISVFSSNKVPTANIYFQEICHVHIQLIDWSKSPDNFLSSLAAKMKAKFDKYWNKCILSLAVAAILDPRFKMKLVEYYYSQIYGSTALERIKEVSGGLKELFNTYSICSTLIDQDSASPPSSLPGSSNDGRDRLKGFDKFLHETSQSQSVMSDLEKYLDEPVFPRNCDFDILNWWRVHTPRYPILSMMARDVLGTPMSTVSQESAFNAGGRMLDSSRSSLTPDTRQALICTQDWLLIQSDDPSPSSSHYALPLYVETS
ncbi:zinc finger BED domain-containing protein RICESLEEPER 1-like [Hibiscus syriacus]|uniref:zinc finger BED domain-containing protein RICESLEEPER 1-like n=1 Tax=Hibiscus syriacus TaxID=106335 RepID=UPI001920843B|nr:zinc finger BED domain-containing protein RICESLEEPER 1-like [Hibiscus syriacus]XP_039037038.1 zinc finger BED domain-containing protein RICESLEEPER 1-like [Hibiscus syriacus]